MPTGHYTRKPRGPNAKKTIREIHRQPILERFEKFISMEPMTGCWLWTGYVQERGYGFFTIKPTTVIEAHRASWELYRGPIPEGFCVLHRCDTPGCVNPHHLFLGTQGDNVKDCAKKGRTARGERHGGARLTMEQVLKIREDNRQGGVIGREYGVTSMAISNIKLGKRWKHI